MLARPFARSSMIRRPSAGRGAEWISQVRRDVALALPQLCRRAATVATVPPLCDMRKAPPHRHRRCAPIPHTCRATRSCSVIVSSSRVIHAHPFCPRCRRPCACRCRLRCRIHQHSRAIVDALTRVRPPRQVCFAQSTRRQAFHQQHHHDARAHAPFAARALTRPPRPCVLHARRRRRCPHPCWHAHLRR